MHKRRKEKWARDLTGPTLAPSPPGVYPRSGAHVATLSSQWEETREWMVAQLLGPVSQAWGVCRTNPFALISFAGVQGAGGSYVPGQPRSSFVQKIHSGAPGPRGSVWGQHPARQDPENPGGCSGGAVPERQESGRKGDQQARPSLAAVGQQGQRGWSPLPEGCTPRVGGAGAALGSAVWPGAMAESLDLMLTEWELGRVCRVHMQVTSLSSRPELSRRR